MDIKLNKNIITASIVNIIFNLKNNLNQCYKVILASLLLSALSAIGLLNFKWGIFQHQLPIKKFQKFSSWTRVYLKTHFDASYILGGILDINDLEGGILLSGKRPLGAIITHV